MQWHLAPRLRGNISNPKPSKGLVWLITQWRARDSKKHELDKVSESGTSSTRHSRQAQRIELKNQIYKNKRPLLFHLSSFLCLEVDEEVDEEDSPPGERRVW